MKWRRLRKRHSATDQALVSARELEREVRDVLAALRTHLNELETELYQSAQRDMDGKDV